MADTGSTCGDSLSNPLFKNWLKVVLSLRILVSGLKDFVENYCKQLHDHFITEVKAISNCTPLSCTICSVKFILPRHAYHSNVPCPSQKTSGIRCRCNNNVKRRMCPTKAAPCSVLHDLIVEYHHSHYPFWGNTDCQSWVNDYWAVAKCYLSTTGYASSTSAADMDSTGLLSLCINNDFLRRHIDDISNFEKVRNWRNILFHSPSLEFQESDMKRAIQDMINVLEDKKLLVNEGSAQSAVVKLSEITKEDFVLTLEESRSLLSEMINAIEIQKYAAIREINAYTDTKLDAIRAEFVKYRDQVTDMEAFRTYLVETYKNHCLKSDVSPLFPEEDDNIDDLYVSLQMERRTQTLGKKEISASRGADIYRSRTSEVAEQLNTFEELFKKNGEGVENIFIVADAGMGKTTLCRKITSTWCTANDEQECNIPTEKSVKTTMHCTDAVQKVSMENQKCMLQFRFLFYVSLRHATTEHSIEKMVEHQLLQENHIHIFRNVLEKTPEQCLFIVDGLDEWKPSATVNKGPKCIDGLPAKNAKCTTLFTTRPWKLAEIRSLTLDVDSEVHLKGVTFANASVLAGIALDKLNKRRGKRLKVEDFIAEIENKHLKAIVGSPLLLKLLLCTWFDNCTLPDTETKIYSTVVKLMVRMYTDQKHDNRCLETYERKQDLIEKLPIILRNLPEFTSYAQSVLSLGEFSFKTFVESDSLVFDLPILEHYGMTKEDTKVFIEMGLLSQSKLRPCSVTAHTVKISYIHRTFQEYFAALYLSGYPEHIEAILAMCRGSRRLAELQEMLRFTSGFVPNAVQMISEHIYKDETANSLVDGAMFTIIQKTLVSCIREAKPLGPKPRSVNIKVIILNTLSDQEVLPLVYPESVNRLDITESVQLDKEQIDCIFAMVNLNHLVIMNDEEVLKSDIMVALLKICKHLKRLELDDYHLLNDPELTILPTSCRLSYIRLFRCKLTHSHITSMISDVPTLKDLKLWTVTCEPDGQCGCLKQIQSVAGAKCKTDDQELMKSACVTNIQVYESSGVFDHLKDSNTLKCLKVMDSTAEKSLGKFTGQCVKLEDLELDSVTFSRYSDGYSLNGAVHYNN